MDLPGRMGTWTDSQPNAFHPDATTMLAALLVVNVLEQNHATSAGFIMADNKIPFFIPSLLSGAATVLLLVLFLHLGFGIWVLILAQGLAQLAYQNWKWPAVVLKEFYHSDKR